MLYVLSVLDRKAERFGTLFTAPTLAVALRDFGSAVLADDAANLFRKYPEDFCLCELGVFDEDLGELRPLGGSEFFRTVIEASEVVRLSMERMVPNGVPQ